MVKVNFLGTGSAGGCPRAGHKDLVCTDAVRPGSKTARRRSALYFETDEASVLIDAGPDVLDQLRGAKIRKLDAVFLTHEHEDASGGLELLDRWLAKRGIRIPLYALPGTLLALKRRGTVVSRLRPTPLVPRRPLIVAGATIKPFVVIHGIHHDIPTAGFRIGGLVFASDMEGAPAVSYEVMKNATVLVIDAALWARKSFAGHQTVPEAIALARTLKPKELILTQIGHGFPAHVEAEVLVRAYAKREGVPFPVRLAYDGLKITVRA